MIYTEYCINQPVSFAALETAQAKPKLTRFLETAAQDPRCRGLFLNSFLIKPTQRICKYPLLLADILKHTPDYHEDYDKLAQSLEKVKAILDTINERKRVSEATSKLIEINSLLDTCDIDLIVPTRHFIREGLLEVAFKSGGKTQEMKVFLFNDIVIVAREKKNLLEFRRRVDLSVCKLVVIADTSSKFIPSINECISNHPLSSNTKLF